MYPDDYVEIKEPEYSVTAHIILDAYNTISRGRVFNDGVPRTISTVEIQSYLALNDLPIDLDIFMDCIYMLDNDFIDKSYKNLEAQRKKK